MLEALDVAQAEALVRVSLATEGHALLRLTGGCLEPAILNGERVRLASPTTHPARFGDVVLARLPEGLRLHRVVWPPLGWRTRRVRTQADHALFLDPAIPREALLAVVVEVERGAGVVPARSAARALRSLGVALFTRVRVALGAGPD